MSEQTEGAPSGVPAPGQGTIDPVTEDVGGVQGSDEEEIAEREDQVAQTATDESRAAPAPDAGEIEWAGGLVKKAPGDA